MQKKLEKNVKIQEKKCEHLINRMLQESFSHC